MGNHQKVMINQKCCEQRLILFWQQFLLYATLLDGFQTRMNCFRYFLTPTMEKIWIYLLLRLVMFRIAYSSLILQLIFTFIIFHIMDYHLCHQKRLNYAFNDANSHNLKLIKAKKIVWSIKKLLSKFYFCSPM